MLNQCNFIGRVGKEPELKHTPSGDAVCNLSIACSESWKNKQGEKQEKTEWVNLIMWRQLAEITGKYVKKGQLIFVSGKMQTRSYDDKDGQKKYITEVVCNEMKMLSNNNESGETSNAKQPAKKEGGGDTPPFNPDDDIPFALPMMYFQDGKF